MAQEHSDEKIDKNGDPDLMETEANNDDAAGSADEDRGDGANDAVASLEAEIAALKDQALRGQAEAENTRRRAVRDVENAHKFALEKFAADLLPVIDSLEKAVEAADSTGEAIGEGVNLALKLFIDVLEKAGIGRIDPLGEPFDPQFHEAMAMVESPDAEPNSVIDVMQKGYSLNGRLIRAAMVVVSKAPG